MFVRLKKRVSKKHFLTLPEDSREWYEVYKLYHYYQILPPSLNIIIRNMKRKLDKQKIKYTEYFEDGFLIIESAQ